MSNIPGSLLLDDAFITFILADGVEDDSRTTTVMNHCFINQHYQRFVDQFDKCVALFGDVICE